MLKGIDILFITVLSMLASVISLKYGLNHLYDSIEIISVTNKRHLVKMLLCTFNSLFTYCIKASCSTENKLYTSAIYEIIHTVQVTAKRIK